MQVQNTSGSRPRSRPRRSFYLEYAQSETLVFDNGRLKQATYNTDLAFPRGQDEAVGYAHSSDFSEAALARAAEAVRAVKGGYSGRYAEPPGRTKVRSTATIIRWSPVIRDQGTALGNHRRLCRAKDPRVRQVSISFGASWQVIEILRGDGATYRDIRPWCGSTFSAAVGDGERQEAGSHGYGGREGLGASWDEAWQGAADDAVRQALVNLEAVPAPAGEMDVVLGPGWPGVMLHEAIGHGLEGDFNRKKTSAFAGRWDNGSH